MRPTGRWIQLATVPTIVSTSVSFAAVKPRDPGRFDVEVVPEPAAGLHVLAELP